MTAEKLAQLLNMEPHPEGGYYAETYRAVDKIKRSDGVERAASTCIYFLLPVGTYSSLHRIQSDEGWHFYRGCPLRIVELDPNDPGKSKTTIIHNDFEEGRRPQHIVPKNTWFAAEPIAQDGCEDFALVGCTVAPGFEFAEFELAPAGLIGDDHPYVHLMPKE